MKNNKLIAEFMGDKTLYSQVDYCTDMAFPFDDLHFHESWDWLMPVVNKCMQSGDNTDEWDALYDALSTVNITNTYNAVVEFINQYNKTHDKR
jgi:hypothetical protein